MTGFSDLFLRKARSCGLRAASTLVLLGVWTSCSSCASRETIPTPRQPAQKSAASPASALSRSAASLPDASFNIFDEYRIGPGDVLDVSYVLPTWRSQDEFRFTIDNTVSIKFVNAPELNETQTIRPDGKISMPYVGEIHAVGKTVAELTADLEKRYASVLRDGELYVLVPEYRSAVKELKDDLNSSQRGLSRLITVRPDGMATFTMLGERRMAGKSLATASTELNQAYAAVQQGLSVDVFLDRHAGTRVYVLGAVSKPGAYEIVKRMTVIEVLALSGSALPSASLGDVLVVRRQGDKMQGKRIDVDQTLTNPEAQSEFFFLQPDDVVYVSRRKLSRWTNDIKEISELLLFRGWGGSISYDFNTDSR